MSDDSIADLSRPCAKSISRYGPSVSGPRSNPCPSLPVSSAFEAAAGVACPPAALSRGPMALGRRPRCHTPRLCSFERDAGRM
jgi:hypothetical protein